MAMVISSGLAAPCSLLMATFMLLIVQAQSITRHYNFNVQMANVTRLCATKSIVTVNGEYPGPALVAREGDRIVVRVANHATHNVMLHWHGVRQLRTGWANGTAYITQCPIQTGESYVYNFTVTGQRGTLWWHAHVSWLRATVYGAIVILPNHGVPYPFAAPHKEVPVIFGEWWRADTEAVVSRALQTGGPPNISDAFTINGLPGLLYKCSAKDTFKLKVEPGKTYMLRLSNATLNDELFFSIANHTLTVVEVDAVYVKPFTVKTLIIAPGQTTNVLLTAMPFYPKASFYMLAALYLGYINTSTPIKPGTINNTTVAAILEYQKPAILDKIGVPLFRPTLPRFNDTGFVTNFASKLHSLGTMQYPALVPRSVDKQFLFTVGLGTFPCPVNDTCPGPTNTTQFAAAVNNISFVLPSTTLLQSHFTTTGMSRGVHGSNFPAMAPLSQSNYTGATPNNTNVAKATKLLVLPFNASMELVMQDTSILGIENHPMHLHGFNFFVVGQGFGNHNPMNDPAKFNLINPVERNTVRVPPGGWVAIRFLADNPGVWLMHCHLEVHATWGMGIAWLVLEGSRPNQKLMPPPIDLPKC